MNDQSLVRVVLDTNVICQQQRFQALLEKLGKPDRAIASEYLAQRELDTTVDPETAALIARVEAKLAKSTNNPINVNAR